ncbi:MAG: 5-(carboxyamino)imidazole ribonucleotide mutase [Eubacteriaceae bacterium]|jgi:5-(carboxyamino)imidazole ribonucleotide mutase|nr:5-(carboxyamino)imidazole ribonucleotide mutase [Eubacteriaceae bacterium]
MKAAVVMGSKSDYDQVKKCVDVLKDFGVETEVRVISAHRTPAQAVEFAAGAEDRGVEVIVACAGMAAHLAGFVAANTPVPVIGVPMKSAALDGMDALLATVMMPSGVPVATVAIDGTKNAGYLAVQILSVKYPELRQKMKDFKKKQEEDIIKIDAELER